MRRDKYIKKDIKRHTYFYERDVGRCIVRSLQRYIFYEKVMILYSARYSRQEKDCNIVEDRVWEKQNRRYRRNIYIQHLICTAMTQIKKKILEFIRMLASRSEAGIWTIRNVFYPTSSFEPLWIYVWERRASDRRL